jgi:formiminotetrahydrofolate cyclodeaminase
MGLEHCTSDPTAGCGSGSDLVSEIRTGNNKVVEKLTSIESKVSELTTATEECCEETNDNLTGIKDRLDTLISNAADCCDAITDRLDIIAGLLGNVIIAPNIQSWTALYTDRDCQQIDE